VTGLSEQYWDNARSGFHESDESEFRPNENLRVAAEKTAGAVMRLDRFSEILKQYEEI
jgi:hypothetical protein